MCTSGGLAHRGGRNGGLVGQLELHPLDLRLQTYNPCPESPDLVWPRLGFRSRPLGVGPAARPPGDNT